MTELSDSLRFGKWLKEERVKRGITQEALAKSVNSAQSSISRWEAEGIPYRYIYCGFQYYFEWRDKRCLDEIPDSGKPQLASGAWLSWWMDTVGVSVEELAGALGVSKTCAYKWRKPETKLPILTEYAIRQAMRDLGK